MPLEWMGHDSLAQIEGQFHSILGNLIPLRYIGFNYTDIAGLETQERIVNHVLVSQVLCSITVTRIKAFDIAGIKSYAQDLFAPCRACLLKPKGHHNCHQKEYNARFHPKSIQ